MGSIQGKDIETKFKTTNNNNKYISLPEIIYI